MTKQFEDEVDRDKVLDHFISVCDWTGAERFTNTVTDLWQRAESLGRLARELDMAGSHDQAQRVRTLAVTVAREGELSSNVQDSLDSSSVLWELAVDFAQSGQREVATDIAQHIRNNGKRARALQALGKAGIS